MTILVDTNVLVRGVHATHLSHDAAVQAVAGLRSQGHKLVIVPQILYEMWVVVTRPREQNGMGLAAEQALAVVDALMQIFHLAPEHAAVFDEWRRLVTMHQVVGKNAHDARLVAAMTVYEISHLLTFNERDFRRYPNVHVVNPTAVILPTV